MHFNAMIIGELLNVRGLRKVCDSV